MRLTTSLILLAGASTSLGLAHTARADGEATTTQSPDQVRAIVAEMIADSETRSSLLQSGGTSGYDGKHFFLASADGKFKLQVEGMTQFRYNLNFQDSDPAKNSTGDGFESGFANTRTRLAFSGHVFEPELFYKIQGGFGENPQTGTTDSSGSFTLLDAYVGYNFSNGWTLQGGQFKLAYLRETNVDSAYQLAVDRSVTDTYFTQGRSQGVQLEYADEDWRFFFAFSDGFKSANTDLYNSAPPGVSGDPADFAFSTRLDVKLSGDWKQFDQFTSPQGSEMAVMIGAALAYQQAENRNQPDPNGGDFSEPSAFGFTADITVLGDGWSLFGAYMGQNVDNGGATALGTIPDGYNQGFVVQGGLYLSENVELFGRFDQIFFAEEQGTAPVNTNEFGTVTGGFNYYVYGQAAKFSMDVQWFLNNAPAFLNNPGINLLAPAEKNEVAFRFQFQLLF